MSRKRDRHGHIRNRSLSYRRTILKLNRMTKIANPYSLDRDATLIGLVLSIFELGHDKIDLKREDRLGLSR